MLYRTSIEIFNFFIAIISINLIILENEELEPSNFTLDWKNALQSAIKNGQSEEAVKI